MRGRSLVPGVLRRWVPGVLSEQSQHLPAVSVDAPDAAVLDAPPEACRNCGHLLGLPRPNFCSACGQETALHPPTVMEFIHQFGGSYVAMEGALWRTLLLLLFLPGRLTREYLRGRKRRYVLPLRLYLTISVVTLLSLQWSGVLHTFPDDEIIKVDKEDTKDFTLVGAGGIKAGMENGKFICDGLPASWCERLKERFTMDPTSMNRELKRVPERFVSHWGQAMFGLLPLYAFYLKLVYLSRRMRWSEHLVFALHLHSFWFVMLGLQLFNVEFFKTAALVAVPVYSLIAIQVVYGGRWWATALRAMTLCMLYGMTLVFAMAIVAVWAFIA